MPLIPKPHFWGLPLSVSGDIVSTKIYDKRDDFDLKLSVSHFWVVMFLVLHPVGSVSLGSFVLLEHLAVLLASALAVGCWRGGFLGGAVCVVDFAGLF